MNQNWQGMAQVKNVILFSLLIEIDNAFIYVLFSNNIFPFVLDTIYIYIYIFF